MFLFIFIIWIILNGKVTLEIVLFGVVLTAMLSLFICRFLDYSVAKEIRTYKMIFYMLAYAAILVFEIIKANFATIRMIFSAKYETDPVIVEFQSPLKTQMANVLLANSITLTPGTITVSLHDNNCFVVHALDRDFAEGMDESIFVKMLIKMEQKFS